MWKNRWKKFTRPTINYCDRVRVNWSAIDRACHVRSINARDLFRNGGGSAHISVRDYSRFSPGPWRKNSLIGISVDVSQDTRPAGATWRTRRGSGFLWGFLRTVPRWQHPKRFDSGRTRERRRVAALPINYGIFIGLRIPLWSGSPARRLVATALRHRPWFPIAACSQIW